MIRYSLFGKKKFQELDLIDEDTAVFKLVGPVLMSVETEEAKENVGKRLELIEEKLKMLDTAIG